MSATRSEMYPEESSARSITSISASRACSASVTTAAA